MLTYRKKKLVLDVLHYAKSALKSLRGSHSQNMDLRISLGLIEEGIDLLNGKKLDPKGMLSLYSTNDQASQNGDHLIEQLHLQALVIDNKSGTSISLFKTEKELHQTLYEYIANSWDEYCEANDSLEDYTPSQAIERYFHEIPFVEEWYVVQEVSVKL